MVLMLLLSKGARLHIIPNPVNTLQGCNTMENSEGPPLDPSSRSRVLITTLRPSSIERVPGAIQSVELFVHTAAAAATKTFDEPSELIMSIIFFSTNYVK
jgi:hypothetical protein